MKTNKMTVSAVAAAFAVSLLVTGCERTLSKTESEKVKSDGTVVSKEKTVKETSDGTVIKKEEKRTTTP